MTKQSIMYSRTTPVNKDHLKLSVKAVQTYEFARRLNTVPLVLGEFLYAAHEYPIVFTEFEGQVTPVAVLGVRSQQNVFLNETSHWQAKYIPYFIRRYPYIFSSNDEGETLTLCIDEAYEGCNFEGEGQALFDEEGEQTEYLNLVMDFLKDYQAHYVRTQNFCAELKALNVLESMEVQFKIVEGEEGSLRGFESVSRDKLKELSDEQLLGLVKNDFLECLYAQINSLDNLKTLLDLAAKQAPAAAENEQEPNVA